MSKSGTIAGLGFGIALGVLGGVYVLAPNVPGAGGGAGTSAQELTAAREDADAADRDAQASDDVVAGLAAKAVAGELEGKKVALISFPDADRETVDRLRWLVDKAGAEVAPLPVTEEMLNPEKGDKLKSVAANSLPAGAQLSEEVLSPGMHTGQLLGAALSSKLPKIEKSAEGEQNRDRGEGREDEAKDTAGEEDHVVVAVVVAAWCEDDFAGLCEVHAVARSTGASAAKATAQGRDQRCAAMSGMVRRCGRYNGMRSSDTR